MQIFRYMAFIWEDYEKEQNREHKGISRTKDFKYPPILPVVYYEGKDNWTAAIRLHNRVFLSDVLGEYIPDYRCIMVQLNKYTNRKLMEKKDELSVIMMINKLQRAADFASLKEEVPTEYVEKVTAKTPEYLLGIMEQVIEILLRRINVPQEEAAEFAEQVKERKMGELFANFEAYDVQATRAEARKKGQEEARKKTIEEAIEKLIKVLRNLNVEEEIIKAQLKEQYNLTEEETAQKVSLYK